MTPRLRAQAARRLTGRGLPLHAARWHVLTDTRPDVTALPLPGAVAAELIRSAA